MEQIIREAEKLLNQPSKYFSLSGITDEGKLVDVEFSFNHFRNISEVHPDHSYHWVVITKERYPEFGINLNSAAVKFNDQTLIEMRQRNIFVDCLMLESRIRDYVKLPEFSIPDKHRKELIGKFITYIMNQLKKKMS